MLYKSNIFGLVWEENKRSQIIIYDDKCEKELAKLSFRELVKNLKFRRDKIFAVVLYKIFVFNFSDFQIIDCIETAYNLKGMIGLSYAEDKCLIAYPNGEEGREGYVQVKNYDKKTTFYIPAFKEKIGNIEISYNGKVMAVANEEGNVIKLFDTNKGDFLQEFEKEKEKEGIKYMSINYEKQLLAVSGKKETIHIFKIDEGLKRAEEMVKEKKIKSEKCFIKVNVKEKYSMFCFGKEKYLLVVCSNRKYYKAIFETKKGELKLLSNEL